MKNVKSKVTTDLLGLCAFDKSQNIYKKAKQ